MRSQKGIVLIFVLLMVLAIMAAVVGVLYSSQISQYVGRADRNATMAERVAQTGLDQQRTVIFQNARDTVAAAAKSSDSPEAGKLIGLSGGAAACNLLGHLSGGPAPGTEVAEPILLDRQKGGGYGRFGVTLTVPTNAGGGWRARGWLTSKGEVLTGYDVEDPDDPLAGYSKFKPDYPYPEAVLHQTLYAHNASLMSHALVTKELDSDGKGFAVSGPMFISGDQEIEIGASAKPITEFTGDVVPFDYWVCLENDAANGGNADYDGDGSDYDCGVPGSADETVAPARPWDNGANAPQSGALILSDMLAEGGETGPASLCTRIRMPQGFLTGSNQDNDPDAYGQLHNITGVHVGIRPDIGGSPIRASAPANADPISADQLAVRAGFKNRPSLTTPYDLDPIKDPDGADTYTGELEVPTGLADFYGSANVTNEQRIETVTDLKGGKDGLSVADASNAADITISYEWLRVNQKGEKTTYYVHGLEKPDNCTGGNRVKHPKYETSANSNAWLLEPPTTCLTSLCVPCMVTVPAKYPETGEPGAQVFPDPFPIKNPGGDIVWPTTDTRNGKKHVDCTGNINADGWPCNGKGVALGGGNADIRIPKFNLDQKLVCTQDGSETPSESNPGFVWDPGKNSLVVEGTVVLEGIEFDVRGRPEIRAQGDGVMVLREREIRLIADNKSYEVKNQTCIGVKIPLTWPPVPCSCSYDAIVGAGDISLPTSTGDEGGGAQGALPTTSYPDEPDIKKFHFALFQHGGKAGYNGSSPNEFTQNLPSWALPEDASGWGDFPKKPAASIPMIVSDPKYPSELNDQSIYAGIWYHDEEIKFRGNAAAVGRVMAPKVTVESKGAQIFGVSGYEYHLNTGFEDWLEDDAGLSTEVIKDLPVLDVASETLADP